MTSARGNTAPGQMMIGHEHRYADCVRRFHAGNARHPVVHRHDQRGRAAGRKRHDFRRQAVAETKSIGHQEIDMREMQGAQCPDQQRGAGGAVGIEIADDQDPARAAMRRQQPRRCVEPLQGSDRQQPLQRKIQLRVARNAARRIHAPQNRMQMPGKAGRGLVCAPAYLHGYSNDSHQGFRLRQNRRRPPAVSVKHRSAAEMCSRDIRRLRSLAAAGRSQRDSTACHGSLPGTHPAAMTPLGNFSAEAPWNALKKISSPATQPWTSGSAASGAPPPQNHSPLIAGKPRAMRARFAAWSNNHISVSLISCRSRAASCPAGRNSSMCRSNTSSGSRVTTSSARSKIQKSCAERARGHPDARAFPDPIEISRQIFGPRRRHGQHAIGR